MTKKRILLADDSLTVQKVVALTLDGQAFEIHYAKTKADVRKAMQQTPPDLIFVSDQLFDVDLSSFPKEIESWTRPSHPKPPVVLISGKEAASGLGFTSVLRKPFSPGELSEVAKRYASPVADAAVSGNASFGEPASTGVGEFESVFNEAFSDEADLVKQTFDNDAVHQGFVSNYTEGTLKEGNVNKETDLWGKSIKNEAPQNAQGLWQSSAQSPPQANQSQNGRDFAPTQPINAERSIERRLEEENLTIIVDRVLARIVPPIVERMVQERLDKLLSEQENSPDTKS